MTYSPRTRSRLRSIESNAASRFKSTLLSNVIHDRIANDQELREMIEASERCIRAQDLRINAISETGDTISADLDRAADSIDTLVTTRVNEVIEEILKNLDKEIDDWDDTWSKVQIDKARTEMNTYLEEHATTEPQQ